MQVDLSGGAGFGRYIGEAIDPDDSAAYTISGGFITSIGGTGATVGWTNILKVGGITATDLAKVNGAAVADIAKMNGVAV